MIILGIVLVVIGSWLLPDALPDFPANIDRLITDLGYLAIVIGVVFLILSFFNVAVGGRKYWF